jgi:hypothetical protein
MICTNLISTEGAWGTSLSEGARFCGTATYFTAGCLRCTADPYSEPTVPGDIKRPGSSDLPRCTRNMGILGDFLGFRGRKVRGHNAGMAASPMLQQSCMITGGDGVRAGRCGSSPATAAVPCQPAGHRRLSLPLPSPPAEHTGLGCSRRHSLCALRCARETAK